MEIKIILREQDSQINPGEVITIDKETKDREVKEEIIITNKIIEGIEEVEGIEEIEEMRVMGVRMKVLKIIPKMKVTMTRQILIKKTITTEKLNTTTPGKVISRMVKMKVKILKMIRRQVRKKSLTELQEILDGGAEGTDLPLIKKKITQKIKIHKQMEISLKMMKILKIGMIMKEHKEIIDVKMLKGLKEGIKDNQIKLIQKIMEKMNKRGLNKNQIMMLKEINITISLDRIDKEEEIGVGIKKINLKKIKINRKLKKMFNTILKIIKNIKNIKNMKIIMNMKIIKII